MQASSLLIPDQAGCPFDETGKMPVLPVTRPYGNLRKPRNFRSIVGLTPIESRFQRLFAWRFEFLGRCPRLDFEIAPLAFRAATGFLKSLQAHLVQRCSRFLRPNWSVCPTRAALRVLLSLGRP